MKRLIRTYRLESLFLEIIHYPIKKELLLYPICYCQVVRREGNYLVELKKILRCSTKSFRSFKVDWRDALMELDLFYIWDEGGRRYYGKEILSLKEGENYLISLQPEYQEDFNDFCIKLIKYWNVLGKMDAGESLRTSLVLFNEELFCELYRYLELRERLDPFLKVLKDLSYLYCNQGEPGKVIRVLEDSTSVLSQLPKNYKGVNTLKFKRKLERALRFFKKTGILLRVRVETSDLGEGKLLGVLKSLLRGFKVWL